MFYVNKDRTYIAYVENNTTKCWAYFHGKSWRESTNYYCSSYIKNGEYIPATKEEINFLKDKFPNKFKTQKIQLW